jgi:hypothetical protein
MKLCQECDGKNEGHVTRICTTCLEKLKEESRLLDCLKGAGVDNWEGYEDALDSFQEGL